MESPQAFKIFLIVILFFMCICFLFVIKAIKNKKLSNEEQGKEMQRWDYYSKIATAVALVVFAIIFLLKRIKEL